MNDDIQTTKNVKNKDFKEVAKETKDFFKKHKYFVVKDALPQEIAYLAYDYLQGRRAVTDFLFNTKHIPSHETWFGVYTDEQIPGSFAIYGDILMETLMKKFIIYFQRLLNLNVVPTYSYARIYKRDDVLLPHKDRPACELSMTLNLGGDEWPIYLKSGKKIVRTDLKPGDCLIYKGEELEHWRDPFKGFECGQVFMHYNDVNGPHGTTWKLDKRPMLGLSSEFCSK